MIELKLHPDARYLRQFGLILAAACIALAAIAFFRGKLPVIGAVGPVAAAALSASGLVAGLLAAIAPRAVRPLYLALAIATYPIGVAISLAALGIIFYGMITPLSVAFRLARRDALRRRIDREAASYWTSHAAADGEEDVERYFRQY